MAESETGPRSSRNATSIMAVTAKRLLVLKRMVFSFQRRRRIKLWDIFSNLQAQLRMTA
jgi:hypothetical protein